MSSFNFKNDLTWRDILKRIGIVLASVAIILWFMPRDSHPTFKIEQGRPWNYSDLTAPFDFPIYKSDKEISAELDSIMRHYEPYYNLDSDIGGKQVTRFVKDYSNGLPGLSNDYISIIANRLRQCYMQGIIDQLDFTRTPSDSTRTLQVVRGKQTSAIELGKVLTTVEAYERLLNDEKLIDYKDILRECNLNNYITPNLLFDKERSETSKLDLQKTITPATGIVQRGQKIVDNGQLVDTGTYNILVSLQRELELRQTNGGRISTTILGQALYVLILMLSFTLYLTLYRKDYFEKTRSMSMLYSLIIVFSAVAALFVSHILMHVFVIPFVMLPMFVRVFMDSRTAFFSHAVTVLIVASMLQRPLDFIAVQMVMGMISIFSLREMSSRSQFFWTAVLVTLAGMATNLGLDLMRTSDIYHLSALDYKYLAISGLLLFCSYPLLYLIEKVFGFTSSITLIELSDMNKEVLRKMSEVAPGTFNHSIQVANLSAAIAMKIGARSQLVRTGALYHDIGKIQNPIFFTENQSGGINPHDHIDCIESAQTIISHVTEGLKLADKYNLPDIISDFIKTHHGQGKAKYFYVKYKNEHPDEPVDELLFTYPGPNPFTKEQAILMMADSVEAASRSLPDYTDHTIRQMVNRIVDGMVHEGYFRECPITYRDIEYSKTVLIEKLKTIYHTRISYPELKRDASKEAVSAETTNKE